MNRKRIMLATFVDLDPTPGEFHEPNQARKAVNTILRRSIPHYTPIVSIVGGANQRYDMLFDHNNVNWSNNVEYNYLFVKTQMNYFNDRLLAHGYLFLNDALDALGFPKTREGQIVGWTSDHISYDIKIAEGSQNIDLSLYTEGCIIDTAFEDPEYNPFKNEEVEACEIG